MVRTRILSCAGVLLSLATACAGDTVERSPDTTAALAPAGPDALISADSPAVVPESFVPGRTPPPQGALIIDRPAEQAPGTSAPPRATPPTQPPPSRAAAPAQPSAPPSASTSDTIRGRAAVVGAAPLTQVVVTTSGGQTPVTGPLAAEIGQASGAEVWVQGRRDGSSIVASRYAVRAVDGIPAVDGVLSQEGDLLLLTTADGRRIELRDAPAALRAHSGGRVWVSGPPPSRIVAFGVLSHHHH
jgi:hypothetical protein